MIVTVMPVSFQLCQSIDSARYSIRDSSRRLLDWSISVVAERSAKPSWSHADADCPDEFRRVFRILLGGESDHRGPHLPLFSGRGGKK